MSPAKTVASFNASHAIGTPVEYRSHPAAEPVDTLTRSAAWVLMGHTAVIMVEGQAGCVALGAVRVIQ